MDPADKTHHTLRPCVDRLTPGDPIGHANLTLVPLRGEGYEPLDYQLAAAGIEAGTLEVTEVSESGSVPELLAVNTSEHRVLLLDGEELVGAKQNRILNTTVLLPPKSETKIPVSCVEQGRWRHVSASFASGGYSPSRLRARKSRDVTRHLAAHGLANSDQGAVWEEVSESLGELRTASPTGAIHDAMEMHQHSLGAYVKALPWPDEACGVVAAINGRFVALDSFDRPETMRQVWPRLVTGYALDAIGRSEEQGGTFTHRGAQALLDRIGEITCRPCPTVGVGEDWRFEAEDVVGQALVVQADSTGDPAAESDDAAAERLCIHLSAFPAAADREDQRRSRQARIQPPSSRGHRRRPDDSTM